MLSGRKEYMGLRKREGEGFIGNIQKRRHSEFGMPPLLGEMKVCRLFLVYQGGQCAADQGSYDKEPKLLEGNSAFKKSRTYRTRRID